MKGAAVLASAVVLTVALAVVELPRPIDLAIAVTFTLGAVLVVRQAERREA